jgi:hypothetical protein
MDERIVENDIGAPQESRGAQRQKVRRTGAGADEINASRHSIIPAASV